MSTARKILSNTAAQLIGKILVAVLGLLTIKMISKYLTVEGMGEYVFIYEFLSFFGIAADLGLFTIAVKEMSEDEAQIPKIIGNILSLRTALILVSMLAAIITAYFTSGQTNPRIFIGVSIATITVFLTILNGTITSVLQTKLQMHYASFANVIGKIVNVAFMAYIIFYGFPNDVETGFYLLIATGILGAITMLLISNHYVKKITPLKYRFDIDLWKNVLIKSIPYGLALILNMVYFRIDSVILFYMSGPKEVGIYGVAMKMLEQFTILPLYFMNSVLPVLTKAVKENSERYKRIIRYAFDFLAALAVPMVVGGVILAYPIIFVISDEQFLSRLSEGFYGSDIAFQILIFAILFQFLNVLFAFILIAVNKQSRLLYINAIGATLNIIANFMLIPHFGFRGAAITSVASELFILIATYTMAKRHLDFKINFFSLIKIVFSGLIMGAVVYLLQEPTYHLAQNWNIFILIPLGALIYLAMLFATKTINKDMIELVRKK